MTYQQDSYQTRRALLGAIATGVAALAGCSGGDGNGTPSESSPSSGPSSGSTGQSDDSTPTPTATPRPPVLGNSTTTTTDKFKIDIKNPGAAAKIELVQSDGREVGAKTLTQATDKVEYNARLLIPGKYVARALTDDGTQVDSNTYEVASELTYTTVGTFHDTSQEKRSEWEDEGLYATTDSLWVWVKNTGTAPTTVTGMEVSGDVPKSGELDLVGRDSVDIYPGQEKVIVSSGGPFGVSNPRGTKGVVEVTVNNKYGKDITHVREISYSESDQPSIGPVIQKLTGDS